MPLIDSVQKREQSLIAKLQEKQEGLDDRTGKGNAVESIVEESLIRPNLLPQYDCVKGAVVSSADPDNQSGAIDRIIYDRSAVAPLVYDPSHSILAIESVRGLVEITLNLDSRKMREDIVKMAPIKAMKSHNLLVSVPGTQTRALSIKARSISPRSYLIGLPSDPGWKPETIAFSLKSVQSELGPPTHVHGLYVIGIGYFETEPVEADTEPTYNIIAWEGPERLFRFSHRFRCSFDRWVVLPDGVSSDVSEYLKGEGKLYK